MSKVLAVAMTLGLAVAGITTPAAAQYGMDKNPPKNSETPDVPRCAAPLGRAAIQEPQNRWWEGLGLSNPEALIKLFALRSGCLRIVDRSGGLAMHNEESALNAGGELQRNSNVGRGQVAAADYFIIPDIANSNKHASGSNFGAALGGLAGGISVKKSEAHTLLTLEDARTTEQLYIAEGNAQKSDVSFGGGGGMGGWSGFGALAGSGYTDTDIGKVISAAYFNAFVDLVHYMQTQAPGQAAANAPIAAERTLGPVTLHTSPSPAAPVAVSLGGGALVYPTGQRNGVWMEVDDEHGNRGWMPSTQVTVH